MLSLLDEETAAEYNRLLDLSEEEEKIVKGADKLCAYIKCLQELERGNREFFAARNTIEKSIKGLGMPEVDFFMENYVSSFTKNIDEVAL